MAIHCFFLYKDAIKKVSKSQPDIPNSWIYSIWKTFWWNFFCYTHTHTSTQMCCFFFFTIATESFAKLNNNIVNIYLFFYLYISNNPQTTINLLIFNQRDSWWRIKELTKQGFWKSTINFEPGHYQFIARKSSTLLLTTQSLDIYPVVFLFFYTFSRSI